MDESLKLEIEALLKNAVAGILPAIETAAKDAVAAASPVAAVFVAPVIDEIDAYVASLLGNPVPVVNAPTDPASQIASLQQHVAALTVATGAATSANLGVNKLAAVAVAANAKAAKDNAAT